MFYGHNFSNISFFLVVNQIFPRLALTQAVYYNKQINRRMTQSIYKTWETGV